MHLSQAEIQTRYFYQWEQRGRGWTLYPYPVQLEPTYHPFQPPQTKPIPSKSDGRVPRWWEVVRDMFSPSDEDVVSSTSLEDVIPDDQAPFLSASPLNVFQMELPREYRVNLPEMERCLDMLGYSYAHLSFELIAREEKIIIQWTCREEDKERFISQFRAYFPQIGIVETGDALEVQDSHPLAIVDFGMSDEYMLPLGVIEPSHPDPFNSMMGIFEQLREGECAMVQTIFQGCKAPWTPPIMDSVTDGRGNSFFVDAPEMPKLALEKSIISFI